MAEQLAELNKSETNDVWSTTETIIGTYDNKPFYRKIIKTTTPSTADTNATVYSGLTSNMNIKNLYGLITSGAGAYNINTYFGTGAYIGCWRRNSTDIGMIVGGYYISCPVEIIIEYTKS